MSLLKSSGTMVKKDELTLVLVPAMLLLADILKVRYISVEREKRD